jgi:hypothetical protein
MRQDTSFNLMRSLKKTLKWLFLIFLIVLASFGIGLSGGVILTNTNKRKDPLEVNTEMVDAPVSNPRIKKL